MSNSSDYLNSHSSAIQKRPYRKLPIQQRNELIRQVFENKFSISKAAQKLGINNSTAKVVIRKYKQEQKNRKTCRSSLKAAETIQNSQGADQLEPTYNAVQYPILFYYVATQLSMLNPESLCPMYNMWGLLC